jgi:hypothetical protein
MSTANYRRRLSSRELWFIRNHGHRVRNEDLAEIIGRTATAARLLKAAYSTHTGAPLISLETAKEIFMHGTLVSDIRLAYDRLDTAQKRWEERQIIDLKCMVGKKPIKDIARDLGKSQVATRYKAIRMGLGVTMFTISRLAKMLRVPVATVEGWTRAKSGRRGGYRVRRYIEGRFVMVHKEDAEWLLEHKELARRGEFEDHPGKLHEYELEETE